ncbi:hypothetical protein BRD17_10160 [Halobacteriales archaeon SW_7_68_16]|nr:MAG: hypothetical protein BRD17_10160 [Halobacteriales archaeon SW_7_68_16]
MDRFDDERGQTLQDYLLGISLFIIVVGFVFALVPSILSPFTPPIESSQTVRAERVSSQMIDDFAVEGGRTTLNATAVNESLDGADGTFFEDRYAVDDVTDINVTIERATSEAVVYRGGDRYRGQAAASVTRVVTLTDSRCDTACHMIVRLW